MATWQEREIKELLQTRAIIDARLAFLRTQRGRRQRNRALQTCTACGTRFEARIDALYCSRRCQQFMYRVRCHERTSGPA